MRSLVEAFQKRDKIDFLFRLWHVFSAVSIGTSVQCGYLFIFGRSSSISWIGMMVAENGIMADSSKISQQQTCKVCGCSDKFDFHVPDAVWKKVVPAKHQNNVVCLPCFDKFASTRDVDYSEFLDVLYFAGERAFLKFEAVSAKDVC